MRKFLYLALFVAAVFTMSCNKKDDAPKTEAEVQEEAEVKDKADLSAQELMETAEFTEEGLLGIIKEPKAITALEYEALFLAYAKCELKDSCSVESCPANDVAITLNKKDKYDFVEGINRAEIHKKLLKHANPIVRAQAMSRFRDVWSKDPSTLDLIVDVLKLGKEPVVLCALFDNMLIQIDDPRFTDLVLAEAKNENPVVRARVAGLFGKGHGTKNEAALAVMAQLLEDENQGVRKAACSNVGGMNLEQFIKPIVAILSNNDEAEIHDKCVDALLTMFYNYPSHENTSAAAYKAYMEYFAKKPRSEKVPPWNCISDISSVNKETIDGWKKRAKYFKAADVSKVFTEIILDDNAAWMARNSAIKVVATWGTLADLKKIKKSLAKSKHDKVKHVMKTLDDTIAKYGKK
ncbi:MAG: HEAT repeat domain-containing protein [Bradymonadales bacterium]|jgi:hypothetical protein